MPSTYNFHDLFTVQVAHRALDALMREELGMFLDAGATVDLVVEEGSVAAPDRFLSGGYAYDDSTFVIETSAGTIEVANDRLRSDSVKPPELMRWIKYVMRDAVLSRDAALLHAAAVAREGAALLFPAWGHTGKTNVLLEFLRAGYDFVADDWSFVSAEGDVLAYPRFLELFAYNFACHPFLLEALPTDARRRRLRRQLAALQFADSLGGERRVTRAMSRWLSDRAFVSMRLPASRLFPRSATTMRAALSQVCLLTNVRSGHVEVSEVSPADLARRIAWFGQFERSRFHRAQVARAATGGLVPEESSLTAETAVLTRAFAGARCVEVTIPRVQNASDMERVRRFVETG